MVYHTVMKYHIMCLLVMFGLLSPLAGCARNIKAPRGVRPVEVTMEVTGYSDDKKSTNWKRNWRFKPVVASGPSKGKRKKVGQTASGTMAKPGTLAADTSLYPFGTVMHIPGYGYGVVEDRGSAIKGQKLDLFYENKKDAYKWGRRTVRVRVWKP